MYAYIADITSVHERTKRLAIFESFIPLGALIGYPSGPLIKETFGFVTVFALGTAASCLNVLITVVFVVDSRQRPDYNQLHVDEDEDHVGTVAAALQQSAGDDAKARPAEPSSGGWRIIFESLQTVIRPRPHNGRILLLAILVIFTICTIIETGDTSLW